MACIQNSQFFILDQGTVFHGQIFAVGFMHTSICVVIFYSPLKVILSAVECTDTCSSHVWSYVHPHETLETKFLFIFHKCMLQCRWCLSHWTVCIWWPYYRGDSCLFFCRM